MLIRLCLLGFSAAYSVLEQTHFSQPRLDELKAETKELFYHGWNAYVNYALPADELKPLSCVGVGPDPDYANIGRNDAMGNFSITVLDTLDMFAIMDDQEDFEYWVDWVKHNVDFDQPTVVQVFETTIRAIGGLLSAHFYAAVPELGHAIEGYDGHLLEQANDLATRLLPAFDTDTGIPAPRVHLQKGIVPLGELGIIDETCSAGAGSLVVEFTVLSELTGNPIYSRLANRAFRDIWHRRSALNLVGLGISSRTGKWRDSFASIGASSDSFYEYALKYSILYPTRELRRLWDTIYNAVRNTIASRWFNVGVNRYTGVPISTTVDALSAFWPGVQVLAGDLEGAMRGWFAYYKLWDTYGSLPERWRYGFPSNSSVEYEWYLLRPEFLESNYYLSQAVDDPIFLQAAKIALHDIQTINRVSCGVAAIQDVRTGDLSDRMDSFFLSETLKYIYLTFDRGHKLNKEMRTMIFSTEAHPLWSDAAIIKAASAVNFPRLQWLSPVLPRRITKKPRSRIKSILRSMGLESENTAFNQDELWKNHCSAFSRHGQYGSPILSSNVFYFLDSFVEYEKPDWLYRRENTEFVDGFFKSYAYELDCPAYDLPNIVIQ